MCAPHENINHEARAFVGSDRDGFHDTVFQCVDWNGFTRRSRSSFAPNVHVACVRRPSQFVPRLAHTFNRLAPVDLSHLFDRRPAPPLDRRCILRFHSCPLALVLSCLEKECPS